MFIYEFEIKNRPAKTSELERYLKLEGLEVQKVISELRVRKKGSKSKRLKENIAEILG